MQPRAYHFTSSREVHIWQASLVQPSESVATYRELLSPEEKRRSADFHFERDRKRYIVARGSLRRILSGYTRRSPTDLQFDTGQYGKPFLTNLGKEDDIEFNLSHCDDLALVAVTCGQRVGVDIERIHTLQDLSLILDRFFTPEEKELVDSFPGEERVIAFLTLWVRREATVKARGLDLSAALMELDLPLYPLGEGIYIERSGASASEMPRDQRNWHICDLKLDPDHVGAVCVEGKKCKIVIREYK